MNVSKIHPGFIMVPVSLNQVQTAVHHAMERTKEIVRQFIPKKAVLNHLETNFIGTLGELAVRKWAVLSGELDQNYTDHKPDQGDMVLNAKVFDIKTEAIPSEWFQKLRSGEIKDYDPYGCRVFTEKHFHHIKKYSGGIIFCSIPIFNKEESSEGKIRESLLLNRNIMIAGFISPEEIGLKKSTWFTPQSPSGQKRKYNSKNYIFHHTELSPAGQLLLQ